MRYRVTLSPRGQVLGTKTVTVLAPNQQAAITAANYNPNAQVLIAVRRVF